METILKKALDQIKADDNLKKKTIDYILNADSNVVSINSAAVFKKKPLLAKRLIAAACIAAVLCALPIGTYAYYKTPTSYISVDINPSVELGINAFGKVVTVKAYNTDGETVIAGLPLVNSNVENAVRLIVISASQNGFIKDDGSSFISVIAETNSDKKAEKLKLDAQSGAEDAIVSEDETATIQADNMALDRREEAMDLGITPGKLNLIQKLQELDPTIETVDFKDSSVGDIQKKFNELKKEHNGQNSKDNTDETVTPSAGVSPSVSPLDDSQDGKNADNHNDKQDNQDNHSSGNNNGTNNNSGNGNGKDNDSDHNTGFGKNSNSDHDDGNGKNNHSVNNNDSWNKNNSDHNNSDGYNGNSDHGNDHGYSGKGND